MRLAELSTAERRYLSSPLPPVDEWTPLLILRLCRVLGARMKQRVQIFPASPHPQAIESATGRAVPEIHWNDDLDAMWVHARLGGNARIHTRCIALSRNLQCTVQHALAETWMSSAQHKFLPGTLHLRIEIFLGTGVAQQATLAIYFPATPIQMDRWAQRMNAA